MKPVAACGKYLAVVEIRAMVALRLLELNPVLDFKRLKAGVWTTIPGDRTNLIWGCTSMSPRPSGARGTYGSRSQGSASLALGYFHTVPPGPGAKFQAVFHQAVFHADPPEPGAMFLTTHSHDGAGGETPYNKEWPVAL